MFSLHVLYISHYTQHMQDWCCDTHSIFNLFSGFVREFYCYAREKADMSYGRGDGNSREGRRLYAEHYQQRRNPAHKLLTRLRQRLNESGCFAPWASDHGRPRSVRVLRRVQEEPGARVRGIASAFLLSGQFSIPHPHSNWPSRKGGVFL